MAKCSVFAFEGIDDYTRLDENDFSAILNLVSGLATKYNQLGTELGVSEKDLTEIRHENPTDVMRLGDVIVKWLDGKDKPTWRKVVEAINKLDPKFAQDVAKRLRGKDKSFSSCSAQFTEDMRDDEFFMLLRIKGVSEKDISQLEGESITARVFPALDTDDLHELCLSFGARKVLGKLLHEVKTHAHASATCDTSSGQSPSSMASTEKYLKIDDLSSIMQDLRIIESKWYSFGLQLGVPINNLRAIAENYEHPDHCLLEVIRLWLRVCAKPTWRDIVDALKSPTVGYAALGRRLWVQMIRVSGTLDKYMLYGPSQLSRNISDEPIDSSSGGIPKHLGQIADFMYEWDGPIADELGLTPADIASIKTKYPDQLRLQTREVLQKWKQRHGSSATYNNLIDIFDRAGYKSCADLVRTIIHDASEHRFKSTEVAKELQDMSKPNFSNLTVTRWKTESGEIRKFRLKGSLIHKWRHIGNLVVPRQQLEAWSKVKDDYECCEAVLSHWLDHPPRHYPATWEGLYELLDDSELGQVASELKQAVDNAI